MVTRKPIATLKADLYLVIAAFLKRAKGPDAVRDATLDSVARVAYEGAIGR